MSLPSSLLHTLWRVALDVLAFPPSQELALCSLECVVLLPVCD